MNKIDVAELYEDSSFFDFLVYIARRGNIKEFDDFRQDVFLEILESGCTNIQSCKKAANRVQTRYRDEEREATMSYDDMDWLVLDDKARYVG